MGRSCCCWYQEVLPSLLLMMNGELNLHLHNLHVSSWTPCLINVLKMHGSTFVRVGLLYEWRWRWIIECLWIEETKQDVHIKFKRGTCFYMREKIDREETGPSCGLGSISFPVRKREQRMYPPMYGSTIVISNYVELPGFGAYVERSTFWPLYTVIRRYVTGWWHKIK